MTNDFLSISKDFLGTVTGGYRADGGGGDQPPNGSGNDPSQCGEDRSIVGGLGGRATGSGIGGGLGGRVR